MSSTEFKKSQTTDSFARAQEARKRRVFLNPEFNPLEDDGHCCGPVGCGPVEPPAPVILQVSTGTYEVTGSKYPLVRLVVEVLRHRTWHLLQGHGFRD